MVTFISKSAEETQSVGEEWGRAARDGWVIALTGDLGAGKTQLVSGIARGLEIRERVLSPTFTLVHEYRRGRLPLFHLDLYRLENADQVEGAGLEEYLNRRTGVVVVEWAERWFGELGEGQGMRMSFAAALFRWVRIKVVSEAEREITYEDFGH